MDVSSVQSSMMQMPQFSTEPMTEDQISALESILEKYDPEKMSDDEKKTMMDELKEAGIKPSKESKEMIETAGFDIGKPPEGKGPQGPPPDGMMQKMKEMNPEIADLFDQFKNGDIEEDELKSQLEQYSSDIGQFTGDFADFFI